MLFARCASVSLIALATLLVSTAKAGPSEIAEIADLKRMTDGASCSQVVQDLAVKYLEVMDVSDKVSPLGAQDKLVLKGYESQSPGTYGQDFRAVFQLVRKGKPAKKLVYKLRGDYDCDALKVKNLSIGGVERTD